jgi:hypothetical protein
MKDETRFAREGLGMSKKEDRGLAAGDERVAADAEKARQAALRMEFEVLAEEMAGDSEGFALGPAEEPCGRAMYDQYYCAALGGVVGFYGVNRTKPAVLDDMAHRLALQSMATEKMRRADAARLMEAGELHHEGEEEKAEG